jgi:hypothetical protein
MIRNLLLLVIICVLHYGIAVARTTVVINKDDSIGPKKPPNKSVLFQNIRLRRSFETSNQKPEPARIQVSIPDKGEANWVVDAGLSADIARISNTITSNILVEYHHNTLIRKIQNNFQAGYGLNYFGDKATGLNSIITFNLQYVRNWQLPSNSLAVTGNYTLFNQDKGLRLNQAGYLRHKTYTYNLNPYVGFEYQYIGGTTGKNGNILRPLANVSAAIALNKKQTPKEAANSTPPKTIELNAGYVMRYAVINSTGDDEGYTQLLNAGLSYYIVSSKMLSASLGVSYNHGSDPLLGLSDQSYWLIALQLELGRRR